MTSESPKPQIIKPEHAPQNQLRYARGSVIHLVDAAIGANQVDLHLNIIKAGSQAGPYHFHKQVENVYYVLEGEALIRIDGTNHRVMPGQAVFIPPGVPHSATNLGDTDLRILEIYAPVNVDFVEVEDTEDEVKSS